MKQFFQTGKPILKITAAVLLVLAAASLVGAATYAWHILSVAPEAGGMQITIGAAKVIQVAPDVAAADGSHAPGTFGDTLDITKDANYGYLNGLAGLTPVSTADGVHWYLPQYGDAADGTEGPTAFTEDKELAHANVTDETAAQEGSYYYMDFWVSAPEDFNLRLAAGDSKSAGSYALTLPLPQKSGEGVWALDYNAGLAAQKCLRLGFLTGLDGGEESFLIYEPNGTDGGTYTVTTPQSAAGETGDVHDRLTVQKTSQWKSESLNNAFAQFVASADEDLLNKDALTVARQFYTEKLNGLYRPYVTSGQFYQRAADLYENAENAENAPISGAATDGVILRLKANQPQRIRLFVWLEGQDVDCTNDAQNALLGIHLELAGSDQ
mgnify:FL=1